MTKGGTIYNVVQPEGYNIIEPIQKSTQECQSASVVPGITMITMNSIITIQLILGKVAMCYQQHDALS